MAIQTPTTMGYGLKAILAGADFQQQRALQEQQIRAQREAQGRQFGMGLLNKGIDFALGTLERQQQFGMRKDLASQEFEFSKQLSALSSQRAKDIAEYQSKTWLDSHLFEKYGYTKDQLEEVALKTDIPVDQLMLNMQQEKNDAALMSRLQLTGKMMPQLVGPGAAQVFDQSVASAATPVLNPREEAAVGSMVASEISNSVEQKKVGQAIGAEFTQGLDPISKSKIIELNNKEAAIRNDPQLQGTAAQGQFLNAIRLRRNALMRTTMVPRQVSPDEAMSNFVSSATKQIKGIVEAAPGAEWEINADPKNPGFTVKSPKPEKMKPADPMKTPLPQGTEPPAWESLAHAVKFEYFEPRHKAALEASKQKFSDGKGGETYGPPVNEAEIWRQAQQDYENTSGFASIRKQRFQQEAMVTADALAKGAQPEALIVDLVKSGKPQMEAQQIVGAAIGIVSSMWTQRQESAQPIPQSQPTPSPEQAAGMPGAQQTESVQQARSRIEEIKTRFTREQIASDPNLQAELRRLATIVRGGG